MVRDNMVSCTPKEGLSYPLGEVEMVVLQEGLRNIRTADVALATESSSVCLVIIARLEPDQPRCLCNWAQNHTYSIRTMSAAASIQEQCRVVQYTDKVHYSACLLQCANEYFAQRAYS